MRKALAMLAAAAAFAAPAKAAEVNVWSTTFNLDDYFETLGPFPWASLGVFFGGGTIESALGFPGFGTKLFRNATDGTTEFVATGLGAHTHLRLKFDIAFLDSWDSLDGPRPFAPDILFVDIDGLAYEWTVNNATGTVFNISPGTVISTGTNLGYNPDWSDTVVRYDFFFPHTSSNFRLKIRFGGAGFQGGLDESWAIDNFALLAVPAGGGGGGDPVPTPASWLTLLAGVGLLGLAARRRTAQV